MEITPEAMHQVAAAFKRYELEVHASKLAPSSKWNYVKFAQHLVDWLNGEFEPGSRVSSR